MFFSKRHLFFFGKSQSLEKSRPASISTWWEQGNVFTGSFLSTSLQLRYPAQVKHIPSSIFSQIANKRVQSWTSSHCVLHGPQRIKTMFSKLQGLSRIQLYFLRPRNTTCHKTFEKSKWSVSFYFFLFGKSPKHASVQIANLSSSLPAQPRHLQSIWNNHDPDRFVLQKFGTKCCREHVFAQAKHGKGLTRRESIYWFGPYVQAFCSSLSLQIRSDQVSKELMTSYLLIHLQLFFVAFTSWGPEVESQGRPEHWTGRHRRLARD